MEIFLLDMGLKQYGDSIVIKNGDRKILIDGGHQSDFSSLRYQLGVILQAAPPFQFDLLITTHNHDDHIGCLPELVESGEITAKTCLLTDPAFRWDPEKRDSFIEGFLEEDHSHLDNDQLAQFLFEIAGLETRYRKMIETLEPRSKVILFQGVDAHGGDLKELCEEFKDFGLQILGPTNNQLKITQRALQVVKDTIAEYIKRLYAVDFIKTQADLYRKVFEQYLTNSVVFEKARRNGGAINDESIVLKFQCNGWSALLTGDMQFADPDVEGIDEEISKLMDHVYGAGPYQFIKTSHHTSHNGQSEVMLDRWIGQGTGFFAHSGGQEDDDHPAAVVLRMLEERKEMLKFARTDRNGRIKVAKDNNGNLKFYLSKGQENDFEPNLLTVRRQGAASLDVSSTGGQVQFTAIIPDNVAKVVVTVEIEGRLP